MKPRRCGLGGVLPPVDSTRDRSTRLAVYYRRVHGDGELSEYLRRVKRDERLVVTDRNRPVAELGPPPSTGAALDRLIAEAACRGLGAAAFRSHSSSTPTLVR